MALEANRTTTPVVDFSHKITVQRCELKRGILVSDGVSKTFDLADAVKKFAPTGSPQAKHNVLRARVGHYIGLAQKRGGEKINYLLVNAVSGGDVSWLIKRNPEIESLLSEVYLVVDVQLPRTGVDLPSIDRSGQELV